MIVYLIFARTEYQLPLEQIGELELAEPPSAAALAEQARQQFGSEWLDLIAIPQSAMIRVIPVEA